MTTHTSTPDDDKPLTISESESVVPPSPSDNGPSPMHAERRPGHFNRGPGGGVDLDNLFTYHPPSPEQIPLYERMRAAQREMAQVLLETAPASAERSTALAKIREAGFWANAAIACNPAPSSDVTGSTAPSDQQ